MKSKSPYKPRVNSLNGKNNYIHLEFIVVKYRNTQHRRQNPLKTKIQFKWNVINKTNI